MRAHSRTKSTASSPKSVSRPDALEIAAGILRRGDELLMVRQGALGEEQLWSIPGGRVEPGELVTEAMIRELAEETGLRVRDPGRLAYLVQVDNREEGWFATVFTFEVDDWEGELRIDDPDGYVTEVAWVPPQEALERLEGVSWHRLTTRYLRGELEPRSLWLRRVDEQGREELTGPL
jgi:8-oxo-dGTP diphosphatase